MHATRKNLLLPLVLLAGCLSSSLTSLQVLPAAGTATMTVGQTSQFQAQGLYTKSNHASTTQNLTSEVTWQSSNPAVATISSTGLATGVSTGTASITATIQGAFGIVTGTSNITVTAATSGGSTGGNLATLAIVPASQNVVTANETGQFIAIGMLTSGASVDMTNQVAWSSSDVKVATIDASGLATGLSTGSTTITAIAKASNGTITTATSTFSESFGTSGPQLATLTVYKVGNNSNVGTVQSPNTTPALLINCGSGSGCVGNFTLGSTVVLTEVPGSSTFGGWSANCSVNDANQCTIVMTDNDSVGAIFN